MSDETTPAATPAPAATPPSPAVAAKPDDSPAWLPERLSRAEEAARAKVLAEIGVDDPAKAKKILDDAKRVEEEQKTIGEKKAEAETEAKAARKEADRLRKIATDHAGRMMMALKPEHQFAVKELAGDDPAEQLKAIGILGPTWIASGQVEPLGGQPPAPAANTAPPPNAPPPANPGSPPDHKQVYASLESRNPFQAAAYGLAHPAEVFDIKDLP
jgi:hypothetical protein